MTETTDTHTHTSSVYNILSEVPRQYDNISVVNCGVLPS